MYKIDYDKPIHVHFIGIGGAGMSALAKILVEKGYEVSGSDMKESTMTGILRDLGAKIFIGHKAENVVGAEAIVVSSAIREENPEVVEANRLGLKRLHRSDVNAFLINNCKGIAVAGAHGKTTTTSMIGVSLDYEGVSPSIIIGGEVDYLGSNAKLGTSDYLVSEADESDGTFLKYRPYIGIVTNIENGTLEASHIPGVEHLAHRQGNESHSSASFRRSLVADDTTPWTSPAASHATRSSTP